MRLGLAQMNIAWENKEDNLQKVEKFMQDASKLGVKCLLFPEMTLTGFSMNAEKIGEDTKNSPTLRALSEFCKQYHIFAGFGYVEKTQHRFKNRYVIYNESGVIVANYAKIHPFSYGEESYIMLGEIK